MVQQAFHARTRLMWKHQHNLNLLEKRQSRASQRFMLAGAPPAVERRSSRAQGAGVQEFELLRLNASVKGAFYCSCSDVLKVDLGN